VTRGVVLTLWGVLALVAAGAPAAHTNYIVNSGFETGNYADWTITSMQQEVQVTQPPYGIMSHSGAHLALFATWDNRFYDPRTQTYTGPTGTLSQTIVTPVNTPLVLSFWLGGWGYSPGTFSVRWNDVLIPGSVLAPEFLQGTQHYRNFQFVVRGTGLHADIRGIYAARRLRARRCVARDRSARAA
jgi:hypothetical protein